MITFDIYQKDIDTSPCPVGSYRAADGTATPDQYRLSHFPMLSSLAIAAVTLLTHKLAVKTRRFVRPELSGGPAILSESLLFMDFLLPWKRGT
jgi:hypothetical protein